MSYRPHPAPLFLSRDLPGAALANGRSIAAPFELDDSAFEALRLPIRDHFRRRGVTAYELEDLVQTAMMRIWRSRHRLDPTRDPKQYALRTAENLVRDRGRNRPRTVSLDAPILGDDGLTVGDRIADPTDSYEDVVNGRTASPISAGLRHLLEALSELDRATLLLYSEGLPRTEAAARAGISLATYGARLYRAQRRARELIPEYMDEF